MAARHPLRTHKISSNNAIGRTKLKHQLCIGQSSFKDHTASKFKFNLENTGGPNFCSKSTAQFWLPLAYWKFSEFNLNWVTEFHAVGIHDIGGLPVCIV